MGSDQESHRPWLAFALEEALRRSLFSAKDILAHASPEVLVAHLPHQVISEILSRALASGTFSAAAIVETAPPALLAEYLAPDLIWRCLKDIADRAALSKKGAARATPAKQWLAGVLQRGLDTNLLGPADVLRHLPPGEFVGAAPLAVVAELIKNGLTRGSFDPALVLQHLTPTVISESLETALAWSAIAEAVARRFPMDDSPTVVGVAIAAPVSQDKTPPPVSIVTPPKTKTGITTAVASGRIDSPPKPPAAAGSAPKPLPAEWKAVDELDLLEEETLPPRPARNGS
jgi:hypothetical protein